MNKYIWLALVCSVIVACGPSPDQLTATAVSAYEQTKTAAPTLTPSKTPSPTSTPTLTPTFTPTFTPTPFGGGSGQLIFASNFYIGKLDTTDGIYAVNSDGSHLRVILDRSEIESMTQTEFTTIIYRSFNGQNYIFVATETSPDFSLNHWDMYAVASDWKSIRKVDVPSICKYIFNISDDGTQIMCLGSGRRTYAADTTGLGAKQLFGITDSFLGLSPDGTTIYFNKDHGRNTWAVNPDGSNEHQLSLNVLKDFLPEGSSAGSYIFRIDRHAVSPDKTQIAFTWYDMLFVTDATDLEFSTPRLVGRLPAGYSDSVVHLAWFPGGDKILVELSNSTSPESEYVIVSTNGSVEKLNLQENFTEFQLWPCGISPDGSQIIFAGYQKATGVNRILFVSSQTGNLSKSIILNDLYGAIDCPIWQK